MSATGGGGDTISLVSSMHTSPRAGELSGDDEVIDIMSVSSGSRGAPAAGAGAQLPAASSAPAGEAATASTSRKDGDIMIDLEDVDADEDVDTDVDVVGGQLPRVGSAASFAQPSSKATARNGLPKQEGPSQVRCCASHAELE